MQFSSHFFDSVMTILFTFARFCSLLRDFVHFCVKVVMFATDSVMFATDFVMLRSLDHLASAKPDPRQCVAHDRRDDRAYDLVHDAIPALRGFFCEGF